MTPGVSSGKGNERLAQSTVRGDVKGLAGKSVIYGFGSVLLKGVSFLLLPLYTRYLTPADYGIIGVATTLTVILNILFPLGLNGALARFYFSASTDVDRRANSGTIWLGIILLAGILATALDLFGAQLFASLFREVPFDPYIRLSIWTAFFSVFGLVPLNLLQLRERPGLYVMLNAAGTLLTIGLIVWLVVGQRLGAFGYLLGVFIGAAVLAVPYLVLTLRTVLARLRWPILRQALMYSLPLVPHGLASWVLDLSDRAILEHYVSLSELGLYSLGYQLGTLMSIVASAVNSAWVPFIFKTDEQHGEAAKDRVARLTTYYALFLTSVALVLSLFATDIFAVMTTPAFQSADRIMPWVVWGGLCGGLYYIPINFLFVKSKTWYVPLVTVTAGAVNIALNFMLVPQFGIIAAAWATLIGYGVMLGLAWLLAQRVYPMSYEYGRLAKMILIALGILAIGGWLPVDSRLASVAIKSGLVLVYLGLLFAVRFFTPSELAWAVYYSSKLRRRWLKSS